MRTSRLVVSADARPALAALSSATLVLLISSVWRPAVLLTLVALVLFTPTARPSTTRLVVNSAVLVGFLPLAMLLPPLATGRTAVIAALLAGVVTAALTANPHLRQTVRPSAQRFDLILVPLVAVAAWIAHPYLGVRRGAEALSVLSLGWDHSGHASMFIDQSITGAIPPWLPPSPDGTQWLFAHYPQWFHSFLVLLAESLWAGTESTTELVVRYARLEGLVFIGLCLLVFSAVLSATRGSLWPSRVAGVSVAASAMLGFPGPFNLLQGHLPFLLASSSVALASLTCTDRRVDTGVRLSAIAGFTVMAASWPLVLPIAAIAVGPVVGRDLRQTYDSQRAHLVSGTLATLAAIVAAYQLLLPVTNPMQGHLVATGPLLSTHHAVAPAVLLVGVALGLYTREEMGSQLLRVAVASAIVLALMASYQIMVTGELTYYYEKLGQATQVIVLIACSPAIGLLLNKYSGRNGRTAVIATLTLSAVGLGMTVPKGPSTALVSAGTIPSYQNRHGASVQESQHLIAAANSISLEKSPVILMSYDLGRNPALANQWLQALRNSATRAASAFDVELYDTSHASFAETSDLLSRILADGSTVVVTDNALAEMAAAGVGSHKVVWVNQALGLARDTNESGRPGELR